MSYLRSLFLFGTLLLAASAHGTVFGSVRGVIHDTQHHPVSEAEVTFARFHLTRCEAQPLEAAAPLSSWPCLSANTR